MESFDQPKIRVVIRKRPLNKKQVGRNEDDVVEVNNRKDVKVREHKVKVDLTKYIEEHLFRFDSAFGEEVNNQSLYEECIRPIISCAFMGARVTCFAYGQTGSGKTYTMNGDLENGCPGIYYLGAEDIFTLKESSNSNLTICISFFQIYCGKLFDLLNNREPLQAREDGKQNVNIVGLTVKAVDSSQEFMQTVAYGSSVRITSQNSTNADSSRSHAILQISLMNGKKIHGKISFIDLAGCERGADTIDQNKQTKIDGAEINKSLLALKQCIRALDQGKNHTPFRGSKLTMVLKDSFTGFCRTVMIGNISPGSGSCENTLNTLRYADRVKELKKGSNGGGGQISKQEQLARELMLPRSQKNKQIIIKNESDSDEEIVITPHAHKERPVQVPQTRCTQSRAKVVNNRNSTSTIPVKKLKYLQKSLEEEDPPKKKQGTFTAQPTNKQRKGIMGNHSQNGNQNKSVNTAEQKNILRGQRNKSVAANHKLDLQAFKKNPKRELEQVLETDRKKFIQNHSAINLLGNHDTNSFLRGQERYHENEKTSWAKINPYIEMEKNGRNFKKMKTDQSQDMKINENHELKEWEKILEKFRGWAPNHYQFETMSGHFQQLVKFIMKEEIQLNELHKKILLQEESMLTQSFHLYNQVHREHKNNEEMRNYTSRLSDHFSGRIHLFSQFTKKISMYQYHLTEHEACERKLIEASQLINNYVGNQEEDNEGDVPLWVE